MANITESVKKIREAIYGKDVRESIAAGIEAINTESQNAKESAETAASNAQKAANDAEAAISTAATATVMASEAAGKANTAAETAAEKAQAADLAASGANAAAGAAQAAKEAANTAAELANAKAAAASAGAAQAAEAAQAAQEAKEAADSAAATAQEAAGNAQTQGAYAQEQGDRAAQLIDEIESTDVGGIAADILALQNGKADLVDGKVPASNVSYTTDPGIVNLGNTAQDVMTNLNVDLYGHLDASNPHGITAAKIGAVPKTRTVNGLPLSSDITLTPEDIGVTAKRTCTFVVGTSTAGWMAADCDYLCDGVDDQVEIQAAINALGTGGGEVRLLSGTYNLSGSIGLSDHGIMLRGNGRDSTILATTSSFPSAVAMVVCNIGGIVCDLGISGGDNAHGIEIVSSDFTTIKNCKIRMFNTRFAIYTRGTVSPKVTHIHDNYIDGGYGIYCEPNSKFVFFQNNIICSGNSVAVQAFNTSDSVFANNFIFPKQASEDNRFCPMYFNGCNRLQIIGNYSLPSVFNSSGEITTGSTGDALAVSSSTRISIIGNTFFTSSWDASAHSIYCTNLRYGFVADNYILDKNYTVEGGRDNTFINNKFE